MAEESSPQLNDPKSFTDIQRASGTLIEPFPGIVGRGSDVSSVWATGDYKISAATVTHADPTGGIWYLCDGSVAPASVAALVGANLPDARGRSITMKGTHGDVDAIGDSDGIAVASRTPRGVHDMSHGHSASDSLIGPVAGGGADFAAGHNSISVGGFSGSTGSGTDSFIVPGNLFIHS